MRLHDNPPLLNRLARATAVATHVDSAFVEKDYWLTTVLWELSRSQHGERVVFKGGTSLSKAYGIIQRFSEDVDLALIAGELSGNQVKKLLDTISKNITHHVEEVQKPSVTSKGSKFRRTVHEYPVQFQMPLVTQAFSHLIIELNSFANPYPHETRSIRSFITSFLEEQGREDLIQEYGLEPFALQILKPTRTFAEKILAVARASYHSNAVEQLRQKIRHTYDLFFLLQQPEIQDFIASPAFFETLAAVQADDEHNHEFRGLWENKHLIDAPIFQPGPELWESLRTAYEGEFRSLVYGPLPPLNHVRDALQSLLPRLREFGSEE